MRAAFRCWSTAARARCTCRSTCRISTAISYVFTGHKVYGPSGIGVLYGKKDMLERMRPFQGGGEMIEQVTEDTVAYNDPPHRFEAGTPPIVQAIGLAAALDYMEKIGRERIAAHEADLETYAHERLRSSTRCGCSASARQGRYFLLRAAGHPCA